VLDKQKKQPAFFQQAAFFAYLTNCVQQITAHLPDFIPQATTNNSYFYG